jgi:succinate dehydrogenase / fumarate reductase cytochrome b subunit
MDNTFLKFSSITKKIVMACAGLFLVTFLLVHLGINLCLLLDDGGKWFIDASTFMATNYIIKIFEVVLFGGFLLHIFYGVILTLKNWASRPVGYYKSNKSETSFFSKYMIWTGCIIFIFLAMHFMNFYFVKVGLVPVPEGANDKHDMYHMAIALFSNPVYSSIYIVFMLLLGFHMYHAFQSAFQTLGINHNKYNCTIKTIALIYSLVVSIGFAIIPVYFLFFFKG